MGLADSIVSCLAPMQAGEVALLRAEVTEVSTRAAALDVRCGELRNAAVSAKAQLAEVTSERDTALATHATAIAAHAAELTRRDAECDELRSQLAAKAEECRRTQDEVATMQMECAAAKLETAELQTEHAIVKKQLAQYVSSPSGTPTTLRHSNTMPVTPSSK